SNVNVFC
ncbi:hypothetical protein VCHENC02_3618B, partial [Vibrio harveyi]